MFFGLAWPPPLKTQHLTTVFSGGRCVLNERFKVQRSFSRNEDLTSRNVRRTNEQNNFQADLLKWLRQMGFHWVNPISTVTEGWPCGPASDSGRNGGQDSRI
jgi:hypothetical protein